MIQMCLSNNLIKILKESSHIEQDTRRFPRVESVAASNLKVELGRSKVVIKRPGQQKSVAFEGALVRRTGQNNSNEAVRIHLHLQKEIQ